MAAVKSRSLVVAFLILAFVAGAIAGLLVASAAASRSARAAVRGAAGLFVLDQERKLADAWNAGDLNAALAHARCAYEAEFGSGSRNFDAEAAGWSLWGGALTHALIVEPNAPAMARARPSWEAIARARIAVVLERLGRTKDAMTELERAAEASGIRDTAKLRELGLGTVALPATKGTP